MRGEISLLFFSAIQYNEIVNSGKGDVPMIWLALVLAQAAIAQPQQQVAHGDELFNDAQKGCAGCHSLRGKGTAVGPDLKGIGRLSPVAINMAVKSTNTQYVKNVTLKTKETFPGMPVKEDEKTVQVFDMSKTPPEAKTVERETIQSMNSNDLWKHPPAVNKLSAQDMADVIAYIKYAATGSKQPVDPDDIH
jgi:putative heme-binding domain-containing protein